VNTAGKHIALLLPGLGGPVSDHPIGDYLEQRPASLDRLLSRATISSMPGSGLDSVLLQCFGLQDTTAIAPLTCLLDSGRKPAAFVMRVDPVHLRADQSCVRLFESHSFTVSQDEADALVETFNEFFAGDGWQLDAPVADRWYLRSERQPNITTLPPWSVAGEDIYASLPQGDAAREWHAMLNEVQMLFHGHDVNLAREQQGRPVINGVWPWGGGVMPGGASADYTRVVAREPLALALASLAGIPVSASPDTVSKLLAPKDEGVVLVVCDDLRWPARYNEIEKWLAVLEQLERTLFAGLVDALVARQIDSLQLMPCNGRCFTTTRRQQRAFWRPVRPFEQVLN
jgi:hypothetical protein